MRALIISILVGSVLLVGCENTQVAEHQTAVPVEKLVYAPLDPGLFAECPAKPPKLTAGSLNVALLHNRDSWQLRAECLADEIQKIHDLK